MESRYRDSTESPFTDSVRDTAKPPGRRLLGVDVARAIAVLGMVAVHFGPNPIPETLGGDIYGVFHGRASILFVFLAGVGVSLLAGGRTGDVRERLFLRGVMLLPLGMWLQTLDHNVLVILQFYAVYFLLAALLVSTRWWVLGVIASLSLTVGPIAYLAGFQDMPRIYVEGYTSFDEPLGEVIYDLFLTGGYPVVIWAAPLLAGMLVGRSNLRSAATRAWMVGGGLALAVGGPLVSYFFAPKDVRLLYDAPRFPIDGGVGFLLTSEPHSQMPVWVIGATGAAAAALGICLILADALPRLIWPLAAAGQMALTVYVAQILLLSTVPQLVERDEVPAATVSIIVFMVVTAAVCTLWRTIFPRGPLEAVLAAPWAVRDALTRKRKT